MTDATPYRVPRRRIIRVWLRHADMDLLGYVIRDRPTVQYHRAHSYHGRTRWIGPFNLFVGTRNDEPAQETARLRSVK